MSTLNNEKDCMSTQQLDIEIAGVRIRGEVSAPEGKMVVFKEARNKGQILAVPSRSAEPKKP